jgi:hypothetical protein
MNSPRRLARIAGVVHPLVAIFSGFAFGFVLMKVYAPIAEVWMALYLVIVGVRTPKPGEPVPIIRAGNAIPVLGEAMR